VAELATGYTVPLSTFLASTVALPTALPDGSEIVPVIVPRSLWADAAQHMMRREIVTRE
jgi:hypothetical protein